MKAKKIRLDHLLVERGLAESGSRAQALILAGRVRLPGMTSPKPGTPVAPDQAVELLEPMRYVSRGGEKLEGALKEFAVDPAGRDCLDVGASTGGFTDCLLQRGARRVLAVDVGTAQLHEKLRQDPRVVSRERTHVLALAAADVRDPVPSLVTVDVSFISLEKVLPHLASLAGPGAEFLALVKPQFEAGPKNAPKGVVRDPEVRDEVLRRIAGRLAGWGFEKRGEMVSPLKGPKGNVEFFLYFVRA